MSNVQIPEDLFMALVKYHLVYDHTPRDSYIERELQDKLDKMVARERYQRSLLGDKETAP